MLTQIINKDNKPVPVKLVVDGTGASQINIGTFETDSEGKQVLRVIDAAPFAYDPVDDAIRQKVVNQNVPLERQKFTFTIPANGSQSPVTNLNVSEYKSFSWGVVTDSAHKFMLETFIQDYEDREVMNRTDRSTYQQITFDGQSNGKTNPMDVEATGLRLIVRNQDTANAHTYTAYLYLRR